jgi:hypothetical protein
MCCGGRTVICEGEMACNNEILCALEEEIRGD